MMHLDTRLTVLFSLPMYTRHAQPAEPRAIVRTTRSGSKFGVLRKMCARHQLRLQNTGRFFTISETGGQCPRVLKGFIMPHAQEWCWFYGAKGSPKAVHFAEDADAEAYVRFFFAGK